MPASTDADVDPGIEYGFIIEAFLLCFNCIYFRTSFLLNSINVMLNNERPFINELRLNQVLRVITITVIRMN